MDGGIARTVMTPMSDSDIKEYVQAPVIKYSELRNYPTLDDLLPNVKDCVFLLYEDTPNSGHWTVVSKPQEGVAEYFDSYGGYVDNPLHWTPKRERIQLGEDKKLLSLLFNKSPDEIVYNKIKYQKDEEGVNDCGRWCVLRALKMKAGLDLNQFHAFVEKKKNKMKAPYDVVVSKLIP